MSFITENFLLETEFAQELYHDYAKGMPIIDYHNHLPPDEIASNHQFKNITEVWLHGDHYKWRAMRAFGIDEKFITGSASDQDKFLKWAETVPNTLRNPLYHWTHLELQRYFGIDELLTPRNGLDIYQKTSEKLQEESHSTRGLMAQMNVEVLCTTDDPLDSLEHHLSARKNQKGTKMLPAFRPDKAYAVEDVRTFARFIERLADIVGSSITNYQDYLDALKNRIAFFHQAGSRLSDHGLDQLYFFDLGTFDIEILFKKVLAGKALEIQEIQYFKFETLHHLCKEYNEYGWTQQFHLGALRNNNERMLSTLGPDTGFDSIGDFAQAQAMSKFLNELDKTDQLAKTILYNLNPSQNEVFATMAGNFNDGSIKGKMQFGSAWWYMDQLDGMEKQINTLSNMGLLSCFIGMLTDSRSFLSFPRHEYFRRLLCNIFGNDIKKGLVPNDIPFVGRMIQDISYYNAKSYFDFDGRKAKSPDKQTANQK
ncbi:glucuronate isomerase [Flagellimonas myxillae]|uniref:glucuronate isomerase n=1 Tax=Flagellimonas myxillae TaxID=2942214 RepID=UPI00201F9611|nr:glucuronate isomerase [Muricauda myxillae]MCL6266944.1 glucuronate isomerase [Muricauda myxillae]